MTLRITTLSLAIATAFSAQAQSQATADGAAPQQVTITGDKPDDGYASPKATVAGKTAVSRRQIPNSVSVLTREQMDDQNMVTTWDALGQITGITPISNDLTQSQYRARGAALELQHDGMPSSMPLSGYQQIDLPVYERIEVLRGPAGLLQGSGSFAGTVNMVHKRPKADFKASGAASFGSWNNRHVEADVSTPLSADKSLRGRAVASVVDREFFVNRAWDKKWLVYGVLEYDLAPSTTLGFTATYQNDISSGYTGQPAYTNGQFLTVGRSFNPYPEWTRYHWEATEVAVDVEHRLAGDWKAVAKLTHRDQGFFFHDSYPTVGVTPNTNVIANYARREFDYDYSVDGADAYLAGSFNAMGMKHEALVGANFSTYRSVGTGVNPNQTSSLNFANVPLADPPAVPEPSFVYKSGSENQTTQSGLYTQLRSSLAKGLTSVVGARWTTYDYRSHAIAPSAPTAWTPGAKARMEMTPYGGVVYDLTPHQSVYASYSDIFAPQTVQDATGNVLDPRLGRQLEVGAKGEYNYGKLTTAIAYFDTEEINRPIAIEPKPVTCLVATCYLPSGLVSVKGWEVEVAGQLTPQWSASLGIDHLVTKQVTATAASQGLPISLWDPKFQAKLWTKYTFSGGALHGLALGLGVNAASSSASGTATATVAARTQAKYAVVRTQATYPVNKQLTATLAVNNLFDKTYYTRLGGTNTYNTPGDPRNVLLSLRWSL